MTNTPNISSQIDAFKALRESKLQVQKELNTSKKQLQGKIQNFFAPLPEARKNTTRISRLVSNGLAIYEGIRLGASIISAFRSIFGRKRRRF
ncbi:MAG: hypothetical protein J6W52_01230 [Bacteroidaceae bacterium]|nr:hypothetical protein [Bacteroidaceae bacterium]